MGSIEIYNTADIKTVIFRRGKVMSSLDNQDKCCQVIMPRLEDSQTKELVTIFKKLNLLNGTLFKLPKYAKCPDLCYVNIHLAYLNNSDMENFLSKAADISLTILSNKFSEGAGLFTLMKYNKENNQLRLWVNPMLINKPIFKRSTKELIRYFN